MRSSTGSALIYDADDPTGSNDTQTSGIGWEEQQLLFQQFAGELDLGQVNVTARYAGALANRDEPDRRDYTYIAAEDGLTLSQRGSWSQILYTELDDKTRDAGLDVTVPVARGVAEGGCRAGGAEADVDHPPVRVPVPGQRGDRFVGADRRASSSPKTSVRRRTRSRLPRAQGEHDQLRRLHCPSEADRRLPNGQRPLDPAARDVDRARGSRSRPRRSRPSSCSTRTRPRSSPTSRPPTCCRRRP